MKLIRTTIALTSAATLMALSTLFLVQPAHAQKAWTGCGVNLHGSMMQAGMQSGPITIGTDGQTLGVSLLCDNQFDKIVAGAFVDYDRMFGHVTSLGPFVGSAPTDLVVGARVGWLAQQNALLYAHLGRSWSDFGGLVGTLEGWKYGGGVEIKMPTVGNTSMDLRYIHTDFDAPAALAGTKLSGDAIRLGLTFKFGAVETITKEDPVKYVTPEPVVPAVPPKKALK